MTTTHDQSFILELSQFEGAAAQAVIPGDIEAWTERAVESLDSLESVARHQRRRREVHLGQIVATNLGMSARVEGLRRRETELWERFMNIRDGLHDLRAKSQGPSGQGCCDQAEELRLASLGWVVDSRAEQHEVDAWLLETLYRDNGIVD
ncbi:MAG: hypothetical protein KDB53_00465 [Planctomycetes bacterium]|nr:hypothetical protein [Planctomycetota bacterium]